MELLANELIASVKPTQVLQQKFKFFAPSKTTEKEIDETQLKHILDILSMIYPEKSQNYESEYNSIKCYISYLVTTNINDNSAERLQILFQGLDALKTVPTNAKHNTLQLILLLSVPKEEQSSQIRPIPLPYSDGTQTFSLYADNYFDVVPSENSFLYSNTMQLESTSGSNYSLDSGYFSLPSLPIMKTNADRNSSILNHPNAQSILSRYSDISQYNISSAFTSVQKDSNPERFSRKKVPPEPRPNFVSEASPEMYAKYIIFITHKDNPDAAINPIRHPKPTPHIELFHAALVTLQGLDSNICMMDPRYTTLIVNENIASHTYSPIPLVNLFRKFARIGSFYARLEKLAAYLKTGSNNTVGTALGFALNVVLGVYLVNVVNFEPPRIDPDEITLLQLFEHFHAFFVLIEGLAKIFKCLTTTENTRWEPYLLSLPSGLDLLVYVQENTEGIVHTTPLHSTMCYLLTKCSTPLLSYIQQWIFQGQVMDPTSEFGLETHQDKISCGDEEFWTKGFSFKENFKFPSFLNGIEDTLLMCGKSLTLLRLCDPTHYLITTQPYSQLRMNLCLSTRVLREYTNYWENYKNETTIYLAQLKQKNEKKRKQIELERAEVITKRNEEKRQKAKEHKLERERAATEQKHKLMADLQEQIQDKKRSKYEEIQKERELDAYYASKSGSILETGVEGSGLIEEVKKEVRDQYAALEREAMERERLAEQKKRKFAEKLGIIEPQPVIETIARNMSAITVESTSPIHETADSTAEHTPTQSEDILIEELSEEVLLTAGNTQEISVEIPEEQIVDRGEISDPVDPMRSPTPRSKENYYLSIQKTYENCSLVVEKPIIEVDEELTAQYKDFMDEQNSFTNFPISELVKRSYFHPVRIQASLVNLYALDYFRNTLHLDDHFTILRKFVMMENGEFADSLSMQIFNLLYLPDRHKYFFHLNMILEKALVVARVENLPLTENLALGYREQEVIPMATSSKKSSETSNTDELSNIVLEYNVVWPINVVLRNFSIKTCYTKIFNFLMHVKRSIWCLNSVTSALKSLQDRLVVPNQQAINQIKCLHLYRHEMQHFVSALQNYLANQVLKVSWAYFQARLDKVRDLEELYLEHRNYVNKIMINMVLNTKGRPIYIGIKKIFFYIFKFFTRIQESYWVDNETTLNNFAILKDQFSYYKKFTDYVCSLITKLINNGYLSQLEYLILLIDFNGHFTNQNIARSTPYFH